VADIDGIEPDQGGEQAPIRLGLYGADQITLPGEPRFQEIQRVEQFAECRFIGFLGGGETAFVDAVVEGVVDAVVDCIDLRAQGFWVIIVTRVGKRVEGGIEHADDFRGFIAGDRRILPVPQDGHGDPAGIGRVGLGIDLVHMVGAVDRIGDRARGVGKRPALVQHVGIDDGQGNDVFQFLQTPENQCAVGPGAGMGDIKMIAVGLRLEAGLARRPRRTVRGHPVAKVRILADEFAARRFGIVPGIVPDAVDQKTH